MNQRDKAILRRKSPDGLPLDSRLWLYEDWACLWRHMKAAIDEIATRHKAKEEVDKSG